MLNKKQKLELKELELMYEGIIDDEINEEVYAAS